MAQLNSPNRLERAAVERPEATNASVLLDGVQWSYLCGRYELTPRESQIAELVCQGLRNGSIAQRLDIQPGTVKAHIRNIYRKVKVRNKVAMLLRFVTETRGISGHPGQ